MSTASRRSAGQLWREEVLVNFSIMLEGMDFACRSWSPAFGDSSANNSAPSVSCAP